MWKKRTRVGKKLGQDTKKVSDGYRNADTYNRCPCSHRLSINRDGCILNDEGKVITAKEWEAGKKVPDDKYYPVWEPHWGYTLYFQGEKTGVKLSSDFGDILEKANLSERGE